jgi:hypothetical protein
MSPSILVRFTAAGCAAMLGLGLIAGPAGSHTLRKSGIRDEVKQKVKKDCNTRIKGCQSWQVGRCSQLSAHRINCDGRVRGRNASDGDFVCDFRVNVRSHPREYRAFLWYSQVRCDSDLFSPRI